MGMKLIALTAPFSIDAPAERRFLFKVIGKMNDGPVALEAFCVNLRRRLQLPISLVRRIDSPISLGLARAAPIMIRHVAPNE